ncbi:hypothetical protein D9M69_401140 [compost metagenome]
MDLPPPAAGRLEPVAADRPGAAPLPRPGAAGGRALPRLHRLAAIPRSAGERALLAREAGAAGRADAARPGAAGQAQRQRPPGHLHAARPRRQRAPEGLRPWSAGDPEHRGAGRLAAPAAALHRAAQRGLRRHGFRPAGVAAGGAGNPRAVHQHPADRAGAAPGAGARRLAARAAGLQPRRPRARAHAAQPDPALGRTRRAGAVRQHHRVRERAGGPPACRLAGRRAALRGGEGPRRDQLRHGPDGHPRRRPGNRIHVPPRVLRPGRGGGDPRPSGASAGQLLRRSRTPAGADRHARWRGAARSRRGQPPAAAPVAAAGARRHLPLGAGDAGEGRRAQRRTQPELRRAGRPRRTPGAPAGRPGRRSGKGGRRGAAAFAGLAGGAAGGAQVRRRLPAAGRGASRRAPGIHHARLGHGAAARAFQPGRTPAGGGGRDPPGAGSPRPVVRRCGAAPAACRQPGLPDLHLRFHRPAEGGRGVPRAAGDALPGHRRALRNDPGRPRAALHVVRLRRRPRALADAAAVRRQPADPR